VCPLCDRGVAREHPLLEYHVHHLRIDAIACLPRALVHALILILVSLSVISSSCLGSSAVPEQTVPDSGIEGLIILRPISPIERAGVPNYRPYQATVVIEDADGSEVTQFQSASDGSFRIALPPGEYTLRPESSTGRPHARSTAVRVAAGQFTQIHIEYDSGIR
jgi:Carboxypeptidase regulatory-like domain